MRGDTTGAHGADAWKSTRNALKDADMTLTRVSWAEAEVRRENTGDDDTFMIATRVGGPGEGDVPGDEGKRMAISDEMVDMLRGNNYMIGNWEREDGGSGFTVRSDGTWFWRSNEGEGWDSDIWFDLNNSDFNARDSRARKDKLGFWNHWGPVTPGLPDMYAKDDGKIFYRVDEHYA